MLTEIPAEQFAIALDDCVREVLAEATITRPPIDAIHLAKQLKLLVARNATMPQRARYVKTTKEIKGGRGTILVAQNHAPNGATGPSPTKSASA
jgi:hypothetical protein